MSRVHLVTLGCPKNEVDSEKLLGRLAAEGYETTDDAEGADLVVVNTCAFIEEARQESIDTVLGLADVKADGSRLVVTGCMAERYRDELAQALPEVDVVAGFGEAFTEARAGDVGVPVSIGSKPAVPAFDLLNLPRPRSTRPWAYVKVAEGCDRACGFCAIPSFRGPQRSRSIDSIVEEVEALQVREVVLVARGAHLEAIAGGGLRVADPAGSVTVRPAAVASVLIGMIVLGQFGTSSRTGVYVPPELRDGQIVPGHVVEPGE